MYLSFEKKRVLFESGKKKDPGNYKPVSLTPTPWKVVDKTNPESPYQTHGGQCGSDQHQFMLIKIMSKSLRTFHGEITTVLNE